MNSIFSDSTSVAFYFCCIRDLISVIQCQPCKKIPFPFLFYPVLLWCFSFSSGFTPDQPKYPPVFISHSVSGPSAPQEPQVPSSNPFEVLFCAILPSFSGPLLYFSDFSNILQAGRWEYSHSLWDYCCCPCLWKEKCLLAYQYFLFLICPTQSWSRLPCLWLFWGQQTGTLINQWKNTPAAAGVGIHLGYSGTWTRLCSVNGQRAFERLIYCYFMLIFRETTLVYIQCRRTTCEWLL